MHYLYFLLFALTTILVACGPAIPDEYFTPPPSPYGEYSKAGVEYLQEIGFCPEFELKKCDQVIKKWTSNVKVQIHGNYTESDEKELDNIISDLAELTGLSIKKVSSNADINIYFVQQSKFNKYIPEYDKIAPQEGLFATHYNSNYIYYKATICIRDDTSELKKHHLLREELTQSFGLTRDSYSYTNSVFQQDPQYKPVEYAEIDKEIIRILYDDKIKPGMSPTEVISTLTTQPTTQVASN